MSVKTEKPSLGGFNELHLMEPYSCVTSAKERALSYYDGVGLASACEAHDFTELLSKTVQLHQKQNHNKTTTKLIYASHMADLLHHKFETVDVIM